MSKRVENLTGQQFGELTVVRMADDRSHGRVHWECVCSCGKHVVAAGVTLRNGKTRSCGHIRSAAQLARPDRHGGIGTPEYGAWTRMVRKCTQPSSVAYAMYGGRGVKVCDRWTAKPNGFTNFLADVGPRPDKSYVLSLVNMNGDFEPGNCVWAKRQDRTKPPKVHTQSVDSLNGTNTPEYHALYGAIARCTRPDNAHYAAYGGRGIKVCDRWTAPNGEGYRNFLADMGQRPGSEYSLDRVDVNGDYEPGNCRWATNDQQQNNKRTSVYVEFNSERRTVAEWASALQVDPKRVMARLRAYPDGPAARWLFPGKLYGLTSAQLALVDTGAWAKHGVPCEAVRCVETGDSWRTAEDAWLWTGVNQSMISKCLRGVVPSAGGFTWCKAPGDVFTTLWPHMSGDVKRAVVQRLGEAKHGHGLGGGAGKHRARLGQFVLQCMETGELYASGLVVQELLHISASNVRTAANDVDGRRTAGGIHWQWVPVYAVDTKTVHMLAGEEMRRCRTRPVIDDVDDQLVNLVRTWRATYATLMVKTATKPKIVDNGQTGKHKIYQVVCVDDDTVVFTGHAQQLGRVWAHVPALRGLDPRKHEIHVLSAHDDLTTMHDALAALLNRPRMPLTGDRPVGITSATLNSWKAMCARCLNPRSASYAAYGGRGVKICSQWTVDVTGVRQFLADMGNAPAGCTLDRIDVNGDYCPANCRWATAEQQQANRRK